MKSSMRACDCLDIREWYNKEIAKTLEEIKEINKSISEKLKKYNAHMFSNVGKAYQLTKKEALTNRTGLMKEFKEDYKQVSNEYLALCSLITRRYALYDKLERLKHDRRYDYEQSRNKDNESQHSNS